MKTTKPNSKHKSATNNPDHARRHQTPSPADSVIEQALVDLILPAVHAEIETYHARNLRQRVLSLPVMAALVLTMIWRNVPGVMTLHRMLGRQRILWVPATQVSQPALSERFLTFPADLFKAVLSRVLVHLPTRLSTRTPPVPPPLQAIKTHFTAAYAIDGTVLEAVFRKLQSLRETPDAPLAGHLCAAVDLFTHIPANVWWADNPATNDKAFVPDLLAWLQTHALVVFDLGYFSFPFFDALTDRQIWFVTRQREKTSFTVQKTLVHRQHICDRIIHLGNHRSNPSQHPVRLIEVFLNGRWRQYLTNVLDPQRLSIVDVVALYEQRWHIERMFLDVKRLLKLSYLWVGSSNGIQMQVWATFLFYAVLVDVCDEVAALLQRPITDISIEMVYRSIYFYVGAVADGYTGSLADYYADPKQRDLGIVKRPRKRDGPTLSEQIRRALLDPPLDSGEHPTPAAL